MAKYNVGDVLEITEDFSQLGAAYKSGQKYVVESMSSVGYDLKPLKGGLAWAAHPDEFDLMESVRKVPSKEGFQVGDKVRLLEGAHSSPGYSTDNPEKVKARLENAGLDYQALFSVDGEEDSEGDVHVLSESGAGLYILPEFLVPWVEEEEEEKPVEHMVVGGSYWNPEVGQHYTVTSVDFESEIVNFEFNSGDSTLRSFEVIPKHFDGVLPPVKPVDVSQVALDENTFTEVEQEDIGGWDREEFASVAPKPETVSVDALREALDYLGIQEVFDTENIISLAKRLS